MKCTRAPLAHFYFICGLLLFGMTLGGCSHSAYIPNTPHQIPVVAGERWGGHVGFNFASAADVPIFSSISSNPPTRTTQSTVGAISGAGSALVAGLGIFAPVDIYYTGGLGLRWQFLGLEETELWKATVFGGSMGGRTSMSSQEGVNRAETMISGRELGASVGYLANPDLILYSTYVVRTGTGKTKITQTGNVEFNYEDDFRLSSLVFGLRFGQEWYFNFEFGSSDVTWENGPTGPAFASNIGFGYIW